MVEYNTGYNMLYNTGWCPPSYVPWFIAPSKYTVWWFTYPSEKNMSSSVGMMKFPTEWKNKIHVPNHQPDYVCIIHYCYYSYLHQLS